MKYSWIVEKIKANIEIDINDQLRVKNRMEFDFYTEMVLDSVIINGTEIKNLYGCSIEKTLHDGEYYTILKVEYDAAKEFKKITGVKAKGGLNVIVRNDDLIRWYNEELPKLRKIAIEKAVKDKKTTLLKEKANLKDDSMIKFTHHSSYGYSLPKCLFEEESLLKEHKIKSNVFEGYQTDSDWGDYSIETSYEMTYKQFNDCMEKVCKIVAEKQKKTRKSEEESKRIKEETEREKAYMEVKILKKGKEDGREGPTYFANVEITDANTGESLRFSCRNIFDFGYVINPDYEILPGQKGGLENNGKWQDFDDKKGWYDVRELTEFEKKCLKYLRKFPPVYSGINM